MYVSHEVPVILTVTVLLAHVVRCREMASPTLARKSASSHHEEGTLDLCLCIARSHPHLPEK